MRVSMSRSHRTFELAHHAARSEELHPALDGQELHVQPHCERRIGARALAGCGLCGHELDLPPPERQAEVSQAQLEKMIEEIHAEDLEVLLDGVHDPRIREKIVTAYWELEEYENAND